MNTLLSFSSVKLDLFSRDGARLKSASGFVLEVDKEYYLITNRHVILDAQQEQNKQPYLLKTSVDIIFLGKKNVPSSVQMRKKITVPLYTNDDSPKWIEHPTHTKKQPNIDIVALPIQANLTSILFTGKLSESFEKDFLGEKISHETGISAIPIS